MIRVLEAQGPSALAEAFGEEVERQRRFAFERWGVDTGRGRESLKVIERTRGDAYAVRIFSDDPRVPFQSPNGRRPSYWQVLVERPLKKLATKIGKKAAKRLVRLAETGR